MGKNLIQQRRGKGSARFRAPSKNYIGEVKHVAPTPEVITGTITSFEKSQGHDAPIARVSYDNGSSALMFAPEGVRVKDTVSAGPLTDIKPGNTLELKNIPEGTLVYNLEAQPGDGGKFCRSTGAFSRVVAKTATTVTVVLPSKKERLFSPTCRATVGVVAGGGRTEKPFLKAGKRFHRRRARNKFVGIVSGNSMNAVDHPFGGKASHRHKLPRQSSRHAPPGRKVGAIAPKRMGRRKR